MNILVAEDNAKMRETIKSVLSGLSATFYQCSNGREAVREYVRIQPDWVLMDIRMPELDGLHATEVIKTFDPGARVIIVTNYDDPEFRLEAVQLGIKGYVLKENMAELRKIIRSEEFK